MRVKLMGLLQSASGPYGGRANHLKLTTRHDGAILVTNRKRAMTGDKIYASHAWSRLCWIALDGRWRALPQQVRAEWGKCSRRTTDTAKSNLDEFRAINMPRMILGFPSLRLPPDRFASQAHYVSRNPPGQLRPLRKPLQVWASGIMKPEPQPPGEPPVEGQPFDLLVASEAHPFVPSMACTWEPCPSSFNHCYDTHYVMMDVPFETRPPNTYLEWFAQTIGDPPEREDRWQPIRRIESAAIWYDDRPYEFVRALDIRCRSGWWEGLHIPWPGAWCCEMVYDSPPAVRLSYGYYWRSLVSPRPDGVWDLADKRDIYGTFPWPDQLTFGPGGTILADPPPCVDTGTFILAGNHYNARWIDWTHPEWWAGVAWVNTGPRTLSWDSEDSGGVVFANATPILCCDFGDRRGNWWFKITVTRFSEYFVLEYRKPSTPFNPGWTGLYMLHDPTDYTPWATPLMHVAEGHVHWPDHEPNVWGIAIEELLKLVLAELIAIPLAYYVFPRFMARMSRHLPYSVPAIRQAARAARPVAAGMSGAWKCKIAIKVGARNRREYDMIMAAIRRYKGAKYWWGLPVP